MRKNNFFGYSLICMLLLLGKQVEGAEGAPNSWTFYQTDIQNYPMGWTNAHWIPKLEKMLLFGGHSHNRVGNNSVRLFDPVNDQWEILYANNNGDAGVRNRDNHVSFYLPSRGENGEFWVLRGAMGAPDQFGGIFSLDTNQWIKISDSAAEFGQGLIKGMGNYDYTENASSDWCPELNMGVTFGGRNTDRTRFIEPNDDGGPEPYKYWHTVYDDGPSRRRQNQNTGVCIGTEFYVYGGERNTANGVVRPRALWKMDLMTKTWIRLSDNNLPDGQRIDGGYLVVTYDSGSNVLVVNRGQKFNVYHLGNDTWEYIDAPVDPNADWRGSNHAGVYSPLVNKHIYRWSNPGRTDGYTYAGVSASDYIFADSFDNGQSSSEIQTTNTSPTSYQWDTLSSGSLVYIDRAFTYSSYPVSYAGMDYLRTANDDKTSTGNSFVTFTVDRDVVVYVAHVNTATNTPAWLDGWLDTGDQISNTDRILNVYSQNFAAGTVTLGGNDDAPSMYSVFISL